MYIDKYVLRKFNKYISSNLKPLLKLKYLNYLLFIYNLDKINILANGSTQAYLNMNIVLTSQILPK